MPPTKTDIEKLSKGGMKNFISQMNEGIITRSNCKFCKSKYRQQAEEHYELHNHNIRAAYKFLKEKGEKISYRGVRNHLKRHYVERDKLEALSDYAGDLSLWVGRQVNTRQRLVERIAVLEREMFTLAALTEGDSIDERRRTADMLKKLSDGIVTLEQKIYELDTQREPVEMVIDKLRDIIAAKMKNANEHDSKLLLDVIDELSNAMAGFLVEDKQ
jgi:hypothetical protein